MKVYIFLIFGQDVTAIMSIHTLQSASIIWFLCAAAWTNTDIHEQLKEVYGETCMLFMMAGKWVKQFAEGKTDVHNLQHGGQPSDSMSFDSVQQLHDLLEEDCHVMILE